MASSTKWLLSCILIILLFLQVFADASLNNGIENPDAEIDVAAMGGIHRRPVIHRRPKINCQFACAKRCSKTSRRKVCKRACGSCCLRCHCVPTGTYGNKNSCPCYASLRTHGKQPKCP